MIFVLIFGDVIGNKPAIKPARADDRNFPIEADPGLQNRGPAGETACDLPGIGASAQGDLALPVTAAARPCGPSTAAKGAIGMPSPCKKSFSVRRSWLVASASTPGLTAQC